jgi:hypothetical protein
MNTGTVVRIINNDYGNGKNNSNNNGVIVL